MLTYYINLKTKAIDNITHDGYVEFYGDINSLIEHECEEYTLDILNIYRQEKPPVNDYDTTTQNEEELKCL